MMDTGSSSDDTGILAELKALHRTWCMDGGNDEISAADAGSDQQQADKKESRKTPLTPLEKARNAISKLPASSAGDGLIVPYLFSALDKTNTSPTLPTPEPTDKKKISTQEYELRQMEWHFVLILELWSCASQSGRKPKLLEALSSAILSYRDQQSRQNSRNVDKKKKKEKKRKRDKQESKKSILSQHEKERLFFDHLVNLLSRAPFLLPRDVPLSQFLNDRILSSNRLFWERLPKVVSHIYDNFEIPNPYLKKKEKSPTVKKDKKKDNEDVAAKKRKSEKLQAMAKSKKRQRLALLTTKRPKYQGSHFSANQNGISKLLDTKKTALSSKQKGKSAIAKTDNKTISATDRKSSSKNNLTNTKNRQRLEKADATVQKKTNKNKHHTIIRDENKVNSEKARKFQPKRPKPSGGRQQKNNIDALLSDPMARAPPNKSAQNDSTTRNKVNKSSNADVLLMTPRKTVRSDTASQIIGETPKGRQTVVGETPVPKSRAFQTTPKGTHRLIVGETPVPSHRSKVVVGETPTYENTFGSTPTSESPFFSPPVLPSPSKLPLEERKMPCKQPFKLFGLLKRTNSVGMNAPKGLPKKTLKRTSSIDNARAFLRQKSL